MMKGNLFEKIKRCIVEEMKQLELPLKYNDDQAEEIFDGLFGGFGEPWEKVEPILKQLGVDYVLIPHLWDDAEGLLCIEKDFEKYIADDLNYIEFVPVCDWFGDLDDSVFNYVEDFSENFNADFWKHTGSVYHATDEENIESIMEEGLNPRCKTRGTQNRHICSAVFTSTESEEIHGIYGDILLEINIKQMYEDNLIHPIEREPGFEIQDAYRRLAWKLDIENDESCYDYYISQDLSPNTIIIYGSIPPKYLNIIE